MATVSPTGQYLTMIEAAQQMKEIADRLHPADLANLQRFLGTRGNRLHLAVEPDTVGGPSTWVETWEQHRAAEDLAEIGRSG
jgi:hypothetical protein